MSDPTLHRPPAGEHAHDVVQEEDTVPVKPVVLLILAGVALVVIGVVWPWAILARSPRQAPDLRAGSEPRVVEPQPRLIGGQPESAASDQLLDVDRARDDPAGVVARAAPQHQLEQSFDRAAPAQDPLSRFEWADRERSMVKVPVDVAVRLWLEREGGARARQGAARSPDGGEPALENSARARDGAAQSPPPSVEGRPGASP